jgi:hypothetical protein
VWRLSCAVTVGIWEVAVNAARTKHMVIPGDKNVGRSDGTKTDNSTGQQNLPFFVPRGIISNPDRTFNTEFQYVSSFSPSPTVFL